MAKKRKSAKVKTAPKVELTIAKSQMVINPLVLEAYKRLLGYQFAGTFALVIVLGLALWFSYWIASAKPPLLLLIMMCGMLGALFSALTRLYKVDDVAIAIISPVVASLGRTHLAIYAAVPPIVGAIASVVLYIAFAADVLQGVMFPRIACRAAGETGCADLYGILQNFVPKEPTDYCKALIWGFIAGFSERLVPDTLQMLAAKQQKPK